MMIKLICPSCNGELELPDNLNIAHCLYCGTKILLNQNSNSNIDQYIELIDTAIKAENYDEVLKYCNKVLEIDSKNVNAWIDKAFATFHHTTEFEDKFDDAIIYFQIQ